MIGQENSLVYADRGNEVVPGCCRDRKDQLPGILSCLSETRIPNTPFTTSRGCGIDPSSGSTV
jgi:hypothetical protein